MSDNQLGYLLEHPPVAPSTSGHIDFTRTRQRKGTVEDALSELVEDYRSAIDAGYTVRYVRVPEHALSIEQLRFLKSRIPQELWQSCPYVFE